MIERKKIICHKVHARKVECKSVIPAPIKNFKHSLCFLESGEINMDEKRTRIFMTMAYLVAMSSKDLRTKIGAVVVGPDKEVRSTGYNGLPRGCKDDCVARQHRPDKYFYFEHAERNAIYNAARMGLSMKGCAMYTLDIPCADCARAIIQSGINEVVYHTSWNDGNSIKWKESVEYSKIMFEESGVKLIGWDGEILSLTSLQHGKLIKYNKETTND